MDFNGLKSNLGREDRWGLAAVLEAVHDHRFGPLLRGTVSWERRGLFSERRDHRHQMGSEFTFAGILSVRTGYIWNRSADNLSSWGIGLGLRPGNPISPRFGGQIDYVESEWFPGFEFDQTTISAWVAL